MTAAREVVIEALGAEGDGVVTTAGGPLFVPFALPGELWEVSDGAALRLSSSPDRAAPPCPHFGVCGGCQAQHMAPDLYRRWKEGVVAQAFRHRGLAVEVAPLVAVPPHSRRRAVLGAALKGGRLSMGFREEGQHRLVDLETCVVADPAIVVALPALRALAAELLAHVPKGKSARKDRSARITATRLDDGLDVAIEAECGVLPAELSARLAAIAEAARLVRLSVDGDTIVIRGRAELTISGVAVAPPPGVFLQAVPEAEAHLARLVTAAIGKVKRVADLFSGVGTFTFPLARRAEVLAIDGDTRAVAALQHAARHAQGLKRIEARARDLFREPLSRKELEPFDAVVFDPPRAGAAEQAEAIARSKVPLVVAVSCNPATLARDCRTLTDGGFRIEAVTPVDQFLYTPHVEAVAVLRR